jgi:hypothetical protein
MAQKEDFMRGVKSFLEEKIPEMLDYILVVSTPSPKESSQQPSEAHVRSRAIRALQERKQDMSDLQRESIPYEQRFVDIPRHLAIITSAIVRHERDISPQDPAMADLFRRCRDVERRALYYVSRYASRGGGVSAARPPTSDPSLPFVDSNHSSIMAAQSLSPPNPMTSSYSRPKTAPSAAMSDPALHTLTGRRLSQEFSLELDTSPRGAEASVDDSWASLRRQASRPRSASTDSIPNFRSTVPRGIRTLVEAVRPERKKGFLRNILNRK